MVMNIVYSTVVACLVEVFLIANVSMISSYLRETRYRDSFFLRLTETETLMAFVYLLSGIAIFSVTFFALQERSMRYISRISSAIQNISEGDLNTTIEVRGDDEFTAMAARYWVVCSTMIWMSFGMRSMEAMIFGSFRISGRHCITISTTGSV